MAVPANDSEDMPAPAVTIPLTFEAVELAASTLLESGILGDEPSVTPSIRLAVLSLLEGFVPQYTSDGTRQGLLAVRERILRSA